MSFVHNYIAANVILLLQSLYISYAITPSNPCDPMMKNVSIEEVLKSSMLDMAKELKIRSQWLVQPLRYVNCSGRGLNRIPLTIPLNVQILDLSSNGISEVRQQDLKQYVDLQVLWLQSNCLGDAPYAYMKCIGATDTAWRTKSLFSTPANLTMLNIANNFFETLPSNLPVMLRYLDVSLNGIMKIKANDLSYLKKLTMFAATNLCYEDICQHFLHIDNDTFLQIPFKILQLSKNKETFNLLSYLNSQSLLYVNFSHTNGRILGPAQLQNMTSVKRLDLHSQNPKTKTKLHVHNKTFDKLLALEYLDISCNRIEFLSDNVFQHNRYLIYLDLSGNCLSLSVIDPKYVPDQIKYLHLGYNKCVGTQKHDINTDNNQSLILNHQGNHVLGPSFLKMANLTALSYAQPDKSQLPWQVSLITFHEININTLFNLLQLKRLSKLTITDHYLRNVDLSAIRCLPGLDYLDFSKNMIENIITSQHPCILQHNQEIETNCSNELKMIFSYNNIGSQLKKGNLVQPKATWLILQFNQISSLRDENFKNMPCLNKLDLRNNPITYIHKNAFRKLQHLKRLYLSSTNFIRIERSLFFLRTLSSVVWLHLKLLDNSLFESLNLGHLYTIRKIPKIDFSSNVIDSATSLENGLQRFRNVNTLVLKRCGIRFSNFFLPTHSLTYLDLSQNEIQQLMPKFLLSVPLLNTLVLSQNKITRIEIDLLNLVPNLEYLDFSNNHISVVSTNETKTTYLRNLKVLKLQYNYIYKLSEEVFSFPFLLQLYHLDLRWNSIECYCDLANNFGRWLSQGPYFLSQRPGFIPHCSSLISYGECVTCNAAPTKLSESVNNQPLVQFATTNLCSNAFSVLLTSVFTSFFILFISISSFLSSSKGMLWLAKFSTRRVRAIKDEDEEQNFEVIFAFHGFVLFDTEDINTGNWVDDQLVPELNKISPDMKIAVAGRDDQCGFTPVTQQLLKIEASRKVIVVLTGNYWQSSQGKYVLSAIEDLYYQTGHDRAVIVTFENESHVGGFLKRRRKNSPWSVLTYPEDKRHFAIFWESLRNLLM